MLIILSGINGTGKGKLAKMLADRTGFHLYPVKQARQDPTVLRLHHLAGHTYEDPLEPSVRNILYKKIIEQFPLLSKMYPDVVMSGLFADTASRDHFFSEARKYFGEVVVVWIESSDQVADVRFMRADKVSGRRNISTSVRLRAAQAAQFEPYSGDVPKFSNNDEDVSRRFEDLCALILKHYSIPALAK